jgi:phosphatidylserine decarboxylase
MILHFFRKPERIVEKNKNKIYAPADGTIVAIEEVEENTYFKETRLQISIFMSPLNMHMNLFPLSGVVDFVKHEGGKHWVAWIPKSSKENERTSVVIRHENEIQIMVRQIAGAVARRIVTYCKTGGEVIQGDELGFIKFGSRVDLFLPVEMKLKVKLDQKVQANKTLIASFKE